MTEYIALIRKVTGTDYGVDFPDFPGCVTAGSDLDEALANAREALALHVEGLVEDGGDIPAPATLEAVMADPHNDGAVAALVPAPVAKSRTLRFNATMDEHLLQALDITAAATGMSRSGFLSASVRSALEGTEFAIPERPVAPKRHKASRRQAAKTPAKTPAKTKTKSG